MKRRHHGIVVSSGKRRSHGALLRLRKNPLNMATVKKVALSSLGAGAIAGATGIALSEAQHRIAWASTNLTGYKGAAAKAGIGIVGALALQSFGLDTLAAGVGVGGVMSGLMDAYLTYKTAPAGAVYYPRSAGQTAAPQFNNCYSFAAGGK